MNLDKALSRTSEARRRLATPGILLGLGFGGFIDGIVFHQLLQWHHLLSNTGNASVSTVRGLESNTFADGVFHAATWTLAAIGLVVLWRAVGRSDLRGEGQLAPPTPCDVAGHRGGCRGAQWTPHPRPRD